MNNFERITASPEALGDFLGALPILSGPWDDDFHRVFCDSCDAENCDAENCAHQAERNSPTWWQSSSHGPDRIGRAPRKSPRASGEVVILSKLFTARPPLCGGRCV